MQDIRIRIAAAICVSIASFASITGAVVTLLWWLIFCRGVLRGRNVRKILAPVILISFFSIIIVLTGGEGFTYFFRMSVLVLIGMWLYHEYVPGEFSDVCVWLFGEKTGFEFGIIAELGMQWVDSLLLDFERIRMAETLKGIRWGVLSIVPAGNVLIRGTLAKAEDTAELLAVRGYRHGGTRCPVFSTGKRDIMAGTTAIFVVAVAFFSVSEFFILYR